MARVVVIGGSGHVGTYLVPRLVEAGHEVINVSRGQRAPYAENAAWQSVRTVAIDRDAGEQAGSFGTSIKALKADIVVDMICFTLSSAQHIVAALRGEVQHFLHCGTIWVYGHNTAVPATEDQPLNPAGNFNPDVFSRIARGEALALPNFGLETVHHVHADDVAQIVMRAIGNWGSAVGEAFNAVSPQAVNLRGYAEAMYRRFGHAPNLVYEPFETWKTRQPDEDWQATWEHVSRSPSHSIEKARRLLGHVPRYSSLQAVNEAVDSMLARGVVKR